MMRISLWILWHTWIPKMITGEDESGIAYRLGDLSDWVDNWGNGGKLRRQYYRMQKCGWYIRILYGRRVCKAVQMKD